MFLGALNRLFFLLILLIWILPIALTISYALGARRTSGWYWGSFVAGLLFAGFAITRAHKDQSFLMFWLAILSCCVLGFGATIWIMKRNSRPVLVWLQVIGVAILFLSPGIRVIVSSGLPPPLHPLWSVVLQKGTWQAMNTGSDFAATRQLIITGNRVLAVFDAGEIGYQGKTPMSKYRLLSLDKKIGVLLNQREFTATWAASPFLFATKNGHVILANGNLELLNSDLSSTGRWFRFDRGRVDHISADGTTLAWETFPGTVLLDADTFAKLGVLPESVPMSISRVAALTNNVSSPEKYPNQQFVTRTNAAGSAFIFHDPCLGNPQFLSNSRILVVGCGQIEILDDQGRAVAQHADLENAYNFAGVSQSGTRFALQASDEFGDPSVLIYERFYIYDAITAAPIATIPITDLPERQSWSAFSPDGHYFAVGNPNRVSLYQLP